jgi:hypothetical protein
VDTTSVDRRSTARPTTTRPRTTRSAWDRRARRLLRLDPDGARGSLRGANEAASRSILISATRCTITYVLLPILGPAVGLAGVAGPILGLVLSAVSIVAIVYAARRFFDGDHRWRWPYAFVGSGIIVLLIVQSALDVGALLT